MAVNAIPERPISVTLALCLLYSSLGISVITFGVAWLRLGAPGPMGYFLLNVFMMIAIFQFQLATSAMQLVTQGGLLVAPIVAIALWLYYMIGRGKNWARITVLIFLLLGILDSILGLVAALILPTFSRPPLSLSDFLTSISAVQTLLQIAAIVLLLRRVSSEWFKATKTSHER